MTDREPVVATDRGSGTGPIGGNDTNGGNDHPAPSLDVTLPTMPAAS